MLSFELINSGITDNEDDIQNKLFKFWDDERRTPTLSIPRLVSTFRLISFPFYVWYCRELFTPEVEDKWLSFSGSLLLNLARGSPDFDRSMFDKPLSECQFRDLRGTFISSVLT